MADGAAGGAASKGVDACPGAVDSDPRRNYVSYRDAILYCPLSEARACARAFVFLGLGPRLCKGSFVT